jgi:hypothetical protein
MSWDPCNGEIEWSVELYQFFKLLLGFADEFLSGISRLDQGLNAARQCLWFTRRLEVREAIIEVHSFMSNVVRFHIVMQFLPFYSNALVVHFAFSL